MGRCLYHLRIDSTITVKQEDLFPTLKKSLQSKPERIVKSDNTSKRKPQILLVMSVEKLKIGKERRTQARFRSQ